MSRASSDIHFVFVHGLSGWGSYDAQYSRMPYWGMRGGDVIARLRELGWSAFAASVAPRTACAPGTPPAGIRPGIWNVFPVYEGDHMALQGGLTRKRDIRPFYEALCALICELP